jgi:tRNA G18 (ribose-2'-O)-methylase SpoU
MARQHSHSSTPFSDRKFPIVVLSDGIKSPANIGALFRICDAFGVEEIIFFNTAFDLKSTRLKRTARETQNTTKFKMGDSLAVALNEFRELDYTLVGLEITDKSTAIDEFKAWPSAKVVLVLGNERHGISEEIIAKLDHCHHIEMYGANSSMNVIQAASIGLYVITKQLHNE